MTDKPLSVEELASLARVNPTYIRQLLQAGRLDGYKVGVRTWAIPADVAQAWLAQRRARWNNSFNKRGG